MYVVARQLWSKYFPKTPCRPTTRRAGATTIQQVLAAVSQEHGKPEDLVRDARATVERIKTFIRERDILRLPEPDRCQVIEMPEFQRGNSLAYLDNAPPLDPEAASIYAISPPPKDWDAERVKSFLEEYNRHMLQILTIHEAYPGPLRATGILQPHPSLIRRVLHPASIVEGWAVYTEQMMLDQGYGDGDLALRLNQLKFYLRAVANAILDHKMHCTNMTDDEAMKFLVDGAFQSEGEARLKMIRAKQSSVSAHHVFRRAHGALPFAPADPARAGDEVRSGPLSRSRAGPRLGAGEVSAGTGARAAEPAEVKGGARHVAQISNLLYRRVELGQAIE